MARVTTRAPAMFAARTLETDNPKFHLARHVTSRYDSTRSTYRASRDERVEPCCSTSSTQPKCMGSSCRDVTSQVEFGL